MLMRWLPIFADSRTNEIRVSEERRHNMGPQDFQRKLENQISEWEADIARLESRADETRPEVRARYLEDIDRLKSQKRKAEARLEEHDNDHDNEQSNVPGTFDNSRASQGADAINPLERFR
jgi:hypothetical protein